MKQKMKSGLGLLVVSSAIALCFRFFVLEDFRISSNSMKPNLFAGDFVFVTKKDFSLRMPFSTFELVRFRTPIHSEVVAFSLPDRATDTYVKRVVGIAGDKIEIKAGKLYVNGESYHYEKVAKEDKSTLWYEVTPKQKYPIHWSEDSKDFGPVEVPPDRFFVLGDNREDSVDSRTWGPIPYSCLRGKVALVWFSPSAESQKVIHWVN